MTVVPATQHQAREETTPLTRPIWLSVTQMNQLLGCSEQHKRQRLDKIAEPEPLVFSVGKAFHSYAEAALKHKKATGEMMPIADCLAVAEKVWTERCIEAKLAGERIGKAAGDGTPVDPKDIKLTINWWDDPAKEFATEDKVRIQLRKMVRYYHRLIMPEIDPLEIEYRFELPIPDAHGNPTEDKFIGFIDVVARFVDPDTGLKDIEIWDHKTALFPWKRGKEHDELQATAYKWAVQQCRPKKKAPLGGMKYGIVTKPQGSRDPSCLVRHTDRPWSEDPAEVAEKWPEMARFFEGQMRDCVRIIKAGAYSQHPEWKNCQYCSFRRGEFKTADGRTLQGCLNWLPVKKTATERAEENEPTAALVED